MPVAVTRGNQLVKDLNGRLENASFYASSDEFWFRRTLVEAEKLKAAKPAEGHNVLAQLYGLAGEATLAERHIDIAIHLQPDANLICNKAILLSNLGLFSAAAEPFKQAVAPKYGMFPDRWRLGICVGALHSLASFIEEARKLQLQDLRNVDVGLVHSAVALMDALSITDQQVASALDIAGELLREQRMFFVGQGPELSVSEDDLEPHLAFTFLVPLAGHRALDLDEELGHRFFERWPDMPPELIIHFESGLPLNEHQPERPAVTG